MTLLFTLFVLPLYGAVTISTINSDTKSEQSTIKKIALLFSVLNFFVGIYLWYRFDSSNPYYQFTQEFLQDQVTICHFSTGVDGISLYFILLTTFITPICILAN